MILPVIAYGNPVLREVAVDIDKDYPKLESLLENMWETMYNARGVGLAAPQIGKAIRVFLVDTVQLDEDDEEAQIANDRIKKVFINAKITKRNTATDKAEEGCLSIPAVLGDVDRPITITITYMNEHFKEFTEEFSGFNARVIQHEYDHIEGILFTDMLSPLKKRLIKQKLNKISLGKIDPPYRMKFPKK